MTFLFYVMCIWKVVSLDIWLIMGVFWTRAARRGTELLLVKLYHNMFGFWFTIQIKPDLTNSDLRVIVGLTTNLKMLLFKNNYWESSYQPDLIYQILFGCCTMFSEYTSMWRVVDRLEKYSQNEVLNFLSKAISYFECNANVPPSVSHDRKW